MNDTLGKIMGGIIIGIIVVCTAFLFSVLFAFPFKWLWNYVMPSMFGLPIIGFWKALCMMWLSSLIFKNSNTSTK